MTTGRINQVTIVDHRTRRHPHPFWGVRDSHREGEGTHRALCLQHNGVYVDNGKRHPYGPAVSTPLTAGTGFPPYKAVPVAMSLTDHCPPHHTRQHRHRSFITKRADGQRGMGQCRAKDQAPLPKELMLAQRDRPSVFYSNDTHRVGIHPLTNSPGRTPWRKDKPFFANGATRCGPLSSLLRCRDSGTFSFLAKGKRPLPEQAEAERRGLQGHTPTLPMHRRQQPALKRAQETRLPVSRRVSPKPGVAPLQRTGGSAQPTHSTLPT